MATQAPFPVNTVLTAVALSYRNTALIADMVLPRLPVGTDSFKYFKFGKDAAFTVPDTKIGRKSEANIVEFGGTEITDSTNDYGLKDVVPLKDIRNAEGTPFDPLNDATLNTTRLVLLDREIRVANLVFNAAKYGTNNKTSVASGDRWDVATSKPLDQLMAAFDAMMMRPNKLVLGQPVWTALRKNPQMVEAVKATGAGLNAQGMVSRQQIAELLEIEEIIVGTAWVNTAKAGQTATMNRAWGKFAAAIYTEPVASTQATTFGFTADSGGGVRVRDWFDPELGTEGSQVVQVVDSVKEVLPADDLGFLWSTPIS